ncbi:hypothetical protein [Tautonia sociabilis]|uniref:Uncharacterized protein n=1 Tax=Tautonia sociabilis TaxID=2080755 RepID=A0A432MFD9_9BACT|nr:hypothetical protein [Tautonia sociabilis]RUL84595.1 hypothetical protein TsocGM_20175 [Tautonia sociabilis]
MDTLVRPQQRAKQRHEEVVALGRRLAEGLEEPRPADTAAIEELLNKIYPPEDQRRRSLVDLLRAVRDHEHEHREDCIRHSFDAIVHSIAAAAAEVEEDLRREELARLSNETKRDYITISREAGGHRISLAESDVLGPLFAFPPPEPEAQHQAERKRRRETRRRQSQKERERQKLRMAQLGEDRRDVTGIPELAGEMIARPSAAETVLATIRDMDDELDPVRKALVPKLEALLEQMHRLGNLGDYDENSKIVEKINEYASICRMRLTYTDPDKGLENLPVHLDCRQKAGYPTGGFRIRAGDRKQTEINTRKDFPSLNLSPIPDVPVPSGK